MLAAHYSPFWQWISTVGTASFITFMDLSKRTPFLFGALLCSRGINWGVPTAVQVVVNEYRLAANANLPPAVRIIVGLSRASLETVVGVSCLAGYLVCVKGFVSPPL